MSMMAPAGDQSVVHSAGPALLTERPHQEATEVRVGPERQLIVVLPALVTGGALEARGHRAAGCRPRNLGGQAKLERASWACRHRGGLKVAACALLAKPCSAGNRERWAMLVAKFSPKDYTAVSAATAAVV